MAAAQGPAERGPDAREAVAARRRGSVCDPATEEGGRRGALPGPLGTLRRGLRDTAEGPLGPARPGRAPGQAAEPRACGRPRRAGGAQLFRRPSSERARRPGSAPAAPTPAAGRQRRRRRQGAGIPGAPAPRARAGAGGRRAAPRCEGSEHLRSLRAGLPSTGHLRCGSGRGTDARGAKKAATTAAALGPVSGAFFAPPPLQTVYKKTLLCTRNPRFHTDPSVTRPWRPAQQARHASLLARTPSRQLPRPAHPRSLLDGGSEGREGAVSQLQQMGAGPFPPGVGRGPGGRGRVQRRASWGEGRGRGPRAAGGGGAGKARSLLWRCGSSQPIAPAHLRGLGSKQTLILGAESTWGGPRGRCVTDGSQGRGVPVCGAPVCAILSEEPR